MPIFGLDISHWQGNRSPDWFRWAKAEGIEYIILKATQGTAHVDSQFVANLQKARAAGMIVAAYHYQTTHDAAAQVEHIKRVVPRDVAVIPDVEHNSGPVSITRSLVTRLRGAGYTVPLSYIPRWYWQQIGSPSLAGLPPLWSSRYPDNTVGGIWDEYNDVPARFWDGYGGNEVALLQFTSSGRVGGYSPLDINAFRGTQNELIRLFGGVTIPEDPIEDEEESNMELPKGTDVSRTLVAPKAAKELVISRGFGGLTVTHVKFFGYTPDVGYNELAVHAAQVVDAARPYVLAVPNGAVTAEVLYTLDDANADAHPAVVGFRN